MKFYTEDQVRTMIAQALEMGRQLPPDTCRVTVAGMFYKLGPEALTPGQTVVLIKEPDNTFDPDAILVAIGLNLDGEPISVGYVANSFKTAEGGTLMASEIQDYFDKQIVARVYGYKKPHWILELSPVIDVKGIADMVLGCGEHE